MVVQGDRMEGWLWIIGPNHALRRQNCQKHYFVLDPDSRMTYYRQKPEDNERAVRTGLLGRFIRVEDLGRETVRGRVRADAKTKLAALYTFRMYDSTDHGKHMKLGARHPEEAATWMAAIRRAVENAQDHYYLDAKEFVIDRRGHRRNRSKGGATPPISPPNGLSHPGTPARAESLSKVGMPSSLPDWTDLVNHRLAHNHSMGLGPSTSGNNDELDVVSRTTWRIEQCRNGLRYFREVSEDEDRADSNRMVKKSSVPVMMAVGVVDGPSEEIFDLVLGLGPSRAEWDFSFHRGRVLEQVDGHTDVIQLQLRQDWFPRCISPRDLVLTRYWRREEDGTYVILYRSTVHDLCPKKKGYVRAHLASGGFVISPLKPIVPGGPKRALVRHMLEVDWKGLTISSLPYGRRLTRILLMRIAGLREYFATKDKPHDPISIVQRLPSTRAPIIDRSHMLPPSSSTPDMRKLCAEPTLEDQNPQGHGHFLERDEGDEFYDAEMENSWVEGDVKGLMVQAEFEGIDSDVEADPSSASCMPVPNVFKQFPACIFPRPISPPVGPGRTRFARGVEEHKPPKDALGDELAGSGSLTKAQDPKHELKSSWAEPPCDIFLVRSKSYLTTNIKEVPGKPILKLVAVDWLKSQVREDDLAARPMNVVQRVGASNVKSPFFLVVNIQVPGSVKYHLACYYALYRPLEDVPLFHRFVNGDDRFRNSRFKLIPNVAKGSWLVKQSVGKRACLLGEALRINYHRGETYLELDVDIGSSSVANGVVNLVIGYLTKLTVDLAFLVQANTAEELPEFLLGAVRVTHLELTKASTPPPEA